MIHPELGLSLDSFLTAKMSPDSLVSSQGNQRAIKKLITKKSLPPTRWCWSINYILWSTWNAIPIKRNFLIRPSLESFWKSLFVPLFHCCGVLFIFKSTLALRLLRFFFRFASKRLFSKTRHLKGNLCAVKINLFDNQTEWFRWSSLSVWFIYLIMILCEGNLENPIHIIRPVHSIRTGLRLISSSAKLHTAITTISREALLWLRSSSHCEKERRNQ